MHKKLLLAQKKFNICFFYCSLDYFVEHTGHGIPKIIEKYGKEAFDIQDTYINVIIPFNKKVANTIPSGKNDDKNLSDELTDNEKRILLELINNPSVPYDTLVVELGISRRTVSRVFVSL